MKVDKKLLKELCIVALITIVPALFIYLPFVLHIQHFLFIDLKTSGMQQIFANWDGPNYVMNAMTLYNPAEVGKHLFMAQQTEYYAAHFPLYSLMIAVFAPVVGYLWSGLFVSLLGSYMLNVLFYFYIRHKTRHAFWLVFVLTVFPPRMLIIRSVLAPETLLMFLILLCLILWEHQRFILAGLVGALAVVTKFQALVLVPALLATFAEQFVVAKGYFKFPAASHISKKVVWIALATPILTVLGYVAVASFYQYSYGNFNAYFVAQDIVGMSAAFPYSMFNYAGKWVGTGWLEDIALYIVGISILIAALWKSQHRSWFWLVLFYGLMLILIPQHDIMRLALPLTPFFIITFMSFFESRVFKAGLILSLPAIYFYALNFIMTNQAPITDWGVFR